MGVYFSPSREEAQLHLVCGALWLLSALCWGWVGAKCTVHVCFFDTSVRERRVFVLVCCWERKFMSVFVQVHQMHLCEQDRKTKVCPSFPSDHTISLAHLCGSGSSIHSQFSLSVGGRQTALWHAQSTDLYLCSHTVSFMLFFRADLWAAPPGLSHWQKPSFVCLNRSHTTVLPFILSSHNPQKDHTWTVCSKLSFSKSLLWWCIRLSEMDLYNISKESRCKVFVLIRHPMCFKLSLRSGLDESPLSARSTHAGQLFALQPSDKTCGWLSPV